MQFIKALYLQKRFFQLLTGLVGWFILSYSFSFLLVFGYVFLLLLLLGLGLDMALLFRPKKGVIASRSCAEKFSNGDENLVEITLESRYSIPVSAQIIDEIPVQFQLRNKRFQQKLSVGERTSFTYSLRPVKRGAYHFEALNVFIISPLQLVSRRYRFDVEKTVAVYPSFQQMRKYELMAAAPQWMLTGIKKIRRPGNQREFEQIEKYIPGDDYRRINWKATARKNELMVNHYQDERSQQVFSLIDKGRGMKMPFNGMSLLDYAINSSLVISSVALRKGDKPGLITFQDKLDAAVPASARPRQLSLIMEQLYREKTAYKEHDFGMLYTRVKRHVNHRSLLFLYTNFESIHSMRRELPYLRMLNRSHMLVCIFFENTEVEQITLQKADSIEDIYVKGIAEHLLYEKRQIVLELQQHGIHSILTAPEALSINTLNKYLEIKARNLL